MKRPPGGPKKATRFLKDQAAMLAHAEQIGAAQQLTDEQVGQLERQTRSRNKAART